MVMGEVKEMLQWPNLNLGPSLYETSVYPIALHFDIVETLTTKVSIAQESFAFNHRLWRGARFSFFERTTSSATMQPHQGPESHNYH